MSSYGVVRRPYLGFGRGRTASNQEKELIKAGVCKWHVALKDFVDVREELGGT